MHFASFRRHVCEVERWIVMALPSSPAIDGLADFGIGGLQVRFDNRSDFVEPFAAEAEFRLASPPFCHLIHLTTVSERAFS